MNLKGELHNLKKRADSDDVYLQKIIVVRDKLLAIGVAVDNEELLHITLKGLPKDFNAFRSAIRTRSTKLSFDELSTVLNAEEESLNKGLDAKDSIFAMAATATLKPSGNFNQFKRGRAEEIPTIKVEEEVEVQAITHLSTILSLPFNHISQIPVSYLLDQIDLLVQFVASLVI